MIDQPASIWQRQFLPRLSPFHFARWLFSWRILKRCLFALACLITLIALFYAEENWRGKHDWEKFKREWEAKGEKFDLASFVPPPVPDDQNFAMTPFLAPLFDLNPEPLKPGQSFSRDTNGWQRIQDFGGALFTANTNDARRRWHDTNKVDFDIWMLALQTNAAPGYARFATRTEAATALLQDLEKFKSVADELQAASGRPHCRFNLNYTQENPAEILLPHLAVLKKLALMYQLRAEAELVLHRNEQALVDTKMLLFLASAMKEEPVLISGLVRLSVLQIALKPVIEGLAAHQWSATNLEELQQQLGSLNLLAEYGTAIRGEQILENGVMEYLRTQRRINELSGYGGQEDFLTPHNSPVVSVGYFMPRGWFYQNQLLANHLILEFGLPPVASANHRVYPAKSAEATEAVKHELTSGFPPFRIFAKFMFPDFEPIQRKYAFAQVCVDQAVLACALERFRLNTGGLPQTLDALGPAFIKTIPRDVITGQPFKYRRVSADQFVLYSVGWNEKDDHGDVVFRKGANAPVDYTQGDWVWPPYPTK